MSEKLPEQTAEARTDELTDGQLEDISGGLEPSTSIPTQRFCRFCNKPTPYKTELVRVGSYTRMVCICTVCNKAY